VAIMAFVLIPLAFFWYETDDEDGIASRAATTVCWSVPSPSFVLFFFINLKPRVE